MLGSAAHQADQASYPPTTRAEVGHRPARRHADVVALPVRPGAAAQLESAPASSADPDPTIALNLLGGFRLLVGGEVMHLGRTGERLLAVVACRGRQATRSQIAHTLWPDTTSGRAHANLRTALYRLCGRGHGAIHATNTYLQLPVGMRIDLEQTSRLANRVLGYEHAGEPGLLGEALQANLYDDLLPEWDDEWLGDIQSRYRQLRLAALEQLSVQLTNAGHHGGAVQTALAAVQADPLRDSAHELLIRACLAQGNRHEALIHYTKYRRILRDDLGLDPPASIGQLLTSA